MSESSNGKSLRLARLSRYVGNRFLFIPLDHSVSDGPVVPGHAFNDLVRSLVAGGADGIIVHKGRARTIDPGLLGACSLIVHLSASTGHAPDIDAKVLVGGVEDAIRLGADAVSVHVNIGSATEAAQLADLGAVAGACERWGLPLLAMIYPRGPRIADPHEPRLLSHVVNIAADLGADLVKTTWPEPFDRIDEVVASSPVPVLLAGGPADGGQLERYARVAMNGGCHGLAVGRRVFGHARPREAVAALAAIVHDAPAFTVLGADTPTRELAGLL
ncbi:2-amino-3,7-dideoxy-D-threo-hept-6-ulosonate synthase [Amycolatopsis ultiminotia]|uniref:2-amino-3,7-dideoxy-D-threo-hept-6-ulosonate synthase n=1 Tax=Amycolatopsis ultiminotia TaxID=543629 RepID=A0ABP6XJT6_9PSEU